MSSDAGPAADQFATLGTAQAHRNLLIDGTCTRNAFEILDFCCVQPSALKSKIDHSFDLFADAIGNPSFPEEDFKREQKLQLNTIEQEPKEPFSIALRVYPQTPVWTGPRIRKSITGSGTAASVQKTT